MKKVFWVGLVLLVAVSNICCGDTTNYYVQQSIFPPVVGDTGLLNVTTDVSSPATGKITQASEQALTTWAFEVSGEAAKITSTTITLDGTISALSVTNAKIVDEAGYVVAGPKVITAPLATVTFTETYIVPIGIHKFTFKLDVLPSAINGSNVSARIAAPNLDIASTGMTTGDNTTISTDPAAGNLQTVLGVALTVTTLTQPAARDVSVGTQNFVWATASLDATASGEDVRVSAVIVQDSFTSVVPGADFREIQNVSIWADLTSASSSRGDAYETKVSNNEQPAAGVTPASKAINLTQVITVPKGNFVKIAVVGDLSVLGNTVTPNRHTLNVSAVTASGKTTGNVPSVIYAGAGQQMTVTGAGVLALSLDASSPVKQILISGQQKITVATLKLQANNVEDQDLDQVKITDNGAGVVSSNWYLYSNSRSDGGSTADPIAIAPGGVTANFQLSDNTVTIPANGSIVLTVKTDVAPVDGVTVTNNMLLQVTTALVTDVQSTGKSSGAIINPISTVAGAIHVAMASRPYFSLNASSPSGSLVPSMNSLLAIFNVAADAADEVDFLNVATNLSGVQNLIKVNVSSNCTGAGAAGVTLKDESGNQLDTQAVLICGVGAVTQVAFAPGNTNNLAIAAGTTKKLYIYGNTTGATGSGDNIQLYLSDSADANMDFAIGGSGNFAEAQTIFRGSIYANALSR
ncbi:MAG: hypothetical protein NTX00_02750 [Candidatus Parcubacteria bacterium]|nr:hypothetical protein [Candidatus Parcubacteria bacterium]